MRDVKEIKKKKILDAAYQLFLKKGYYNTKIIDIAELAGIGKGTVYEYFESKEALLLNILSDLMDKYMENCGSAISGQNSYRDMLKELIMMEVKYAEENGAQLVKMAQLLLDIKGGITSQMIIEAHQMWVEKYEVMKKILQGGMDNGEFRKMNVPMATVAIMSVAGSFMDIKFGKGEFEGIKNPFSSESFDSDELMELILKGIGVEASETAAPTDN